MSKKVFMFITPLIVISVLLYQSIFAETLIYEQKDSTIVSDGVIHENIKKFTNKGWLNINVLRVDLTNSNINLDTIFSNKGISYRSTMLNMANDNGSISAINGDFFSPKPQTNLAHSIGPVIQNGKVISTPAEEENKKIFGVFSLSKSNRPSYTYWSKDITITAPNDKSMSIYDINKFGWFTFLYMYDENWGPKTIGKSNTFPTLVEMIVVNNKVQSFSIANGPIDIPKNGYVISGDYEAGDFLKNNFKIGDIVKINIKTIPNWSTRKMAIGGGSLLLKNGQLPQTFSHEKPQPGPQTAIGTTKDNKYALLVTVDGRQLLSKGMNQFELADLMAELGAYNALALDGGGSTTMVSRDLGHDELQIVNKYSDPNPRPVTNGIGVFTTAPKSPLNGIKIEAIDTNIFKDASRGFYVYGYDKYYNPVEVNQDTVKWSFSGVTGKFVNNYFYPSSTGKCTVTAQINDITASLDINVLDYPVELEIYPKNFSISNNPQWLGIVGIDKYGYRGFLHSKDLTFTPSDIVSITDNFLRTKNKSGIIKVSFKNIYDYFNVGSQNSILDTFEKEDNSFWGYPSNVKGNYSITDKYSKEGKYSGKLEFDFSDTNGTKGAYIKFANNFNFDTKPSKLKLWVYAPQQYPQSLKAEIADANNQIYRLNFTSTISWIGWKEVEASFPSDMVFPASLRKLYVVDTDSQIQNKGELYFDNLQVIYNDYTGLTLPPAKRLSDFQNKYPALKSGENSYRIGIVGNIDNSVTINALTSKKINTAVNKNPSFGIFMGQPPNNSKTPSKTLNGGTFSVTSYKNSKFISITAKGKENSIRKKDYNQWLKLFEELKNNTKDNVFILLDCPITGDYGFSDMYEGNLLKETLSNYVKENAKNVWVLYNSDKSEVQNENGVKYIGIPELKSSSNQYLTVTVNEKDMSYKFRKL